MDYLTRVIGPLQTNAHLLVDPASGEAIVIDAAIPSRDWIAATVTARGWRLALIVSTHGHWDHTGDNAAVQGWSREQAEAMRAHAVENGGAAAAVAAEAAVARARAADAAGNGPAADAAEPADGAAPVAAAEPGVAVVDPLGIARRFDGKAGAEIAAHPDDWYRMTDPQPLFAPFPIPPCVPAVELAEGGIIRLGGILLHVLHTPGHTEGSVCLYARDQGLLFAGDTLFADGWGRVDLPGGDPAAMVESLGRLAALPDDVRVLPGHGRATTIGRERPLLELVIREGRLPM